MADEKRPLAAMADAEPAQSSTAAATNGATAQPSSTTATTQPPTDAATAAKPPTAKQLKEQKKAEKQAKRAREKGIAQATTAGPSSTSSSAQNASSSSSTAPTSKPPQTQTQQTTQHRRTQSTAQRPDPQQQLPVRRRPSTTAREPKKENKQVAFFAHLYGPPRRHNLDGVPREVHPQIQALGLQTSSYCVCGSHARCAAMLLALKAVVQSYSTPPGTSLPRHLSSSHLSPQLNYLKSCRPFSISQANAIRWLKNVIATLDPSAPESSAKQDICAAIDTFISERLTVADQVIADAAATHIRDGDVVLTFAKSAVVTQALLAARKAGREFRVVVVDSRPLFEGKNTARVLSQAGIDVTYTLLAGLGHAVRGVTRCFLGAHAVLGNGRLYSRAGTALVAMMAKRAGAPVIVCAESIKFTDRVALDSLAMNELGPEEDLLLVDSDLDDGFSSMDTAMTDDRFQDQVQSLQGWREREHLQILNPLYDVTPAEFIAVVITELGSLPATSAPVVQRISAGAQEIV